MGINFVDCSSMATPFDSENVEIREGFLCPICTQDLHTVDQLQFHFENSHSSEDRAVFHSIKDLFGKAKKRILKLDTSPEYNDSSLSSSTKTNYTSSILFQEEQEIGATSSHTDYFKSIRSSRIDRFVVETNKLLIRLDKLLTDSPSDPAGRKAYEKSVVYWVEDDDVPRCPNCGRSFTLARRKHHCRLCGGIMCANCSDFILFSYARKLTNPVFAHQSLSQPCSPMHRSGSSSSLNSLLSAAGEPHIRSCRQCKQLLDRRDQQLEERIRQPVIVHLYERLKNCMDEAERLSPLYVKMANSLNAGEANFHLDDAQSVRVKLLKLSESVDLLSKRIVALSHDGMSTCKRDLLLQKGIRNRASSFLQQHIVGLPPLPTEEALHRLQLKRQKEVQGRIAIEKQRALEAHQQYLRSAQGKKEVSPKRESSSSSSQTKNSFHKRNLSDAVVTSATGWGPESSASCGNSAENDTDPMIQQMQIIRNYIRQAREAQLYDEVQILETNLKELQEEFWAQKRRASSQCS